MKIEEQFTSVLNNHKAKLEEELVQAKTGFADGMLKNKICVDDLFNVASNARSVEIIGEKLALISQLKVDLAQVCATVSA